MTKSSCIILALVLALAAVAPAVAEGPTEADGVGGFMFGVIPLSMVDLNAALKSYGYPELSASVIGFGGAGQGVVNRVVLGGEGMGFKSGTVAGATHNVSLSGGYGLFRAGYVVKETANARIYPMIGLGAATATLKFIPRTVPTGNEVFTNPARGTALSFTAPVIDLALGADYLITMGVDKKGSGGLMAGLRVGYMQTFSPGEWHWDELTVPGLPSLGFTGPYIRLILGGGGHGQVELPEE